MKLHVERVNSSLLGAEVYVDTFPHFPPFLILQKVLYANFDKNFDLYQEIPSAWELLQQLCFEVKHSIL